MKLSAAVTPIARRSCGPHRPSARTSRQALVRRTALQACIAAVLSVAEHAPAASATNLWRITDCGDGGGTGTLRFAMTNAIDGDIVALTNACSVITLTQGEIVAPANNLAIRNYLAPAPVI